MWGNHIQRVKIVINDNVIEQVTDFKYLGYRISEYGSDLEDKLQTYNKIKEDITNNTGPVVYSLCFLIMQIYTIYNRHHHHHKHQGSDPLISSISTVTASRANASLVFQLFSFLAVCGGMISKGLVTLVVAERSG